MLDVGVFGCTTLAFSTEELLMSPTTHEMNSVWVFVGLGFALIKWAVIWRIIYLLNYGIVSLIMLER